MNNTIQYYNHNAKDYFESTVHADMSEHYEHFLKYLKKDANILDLGCGSGRDSRYFIEHGYKVKAIDGSKEMCSLATQFLNQEVENTLFEEISFENEFDAVWASASLLHENKDNIDDVIRKIKIALKQGGIFYISFKCGDSDRMQGERYFNDMNEESIKDLLKDFTIKELWFSDDVRPGREDRWINCIAIN